MDRPGAKAILFEGRHQLVDRHPEPSLLVGRQLSILGLEQRETIKRRHSR
jgi:hypothetical protein